MSRSRAAAVSDAPPVTPRPREADQFTLVPVLEIADNPRNPRRQANPALQAQLNASVAADGVLEPLLVRPNGHGAVSAQAYELVAGQRRLIAARAAELTMVPAVVKDLTDEEAFDLATIENIQRDDMTPVDEARAYFEIRKRTASIAGVAARVGKPESHVFRRLKLLDLEAPLLAALRQDRLSLGHAEALLRLTPAKRKIAADPQNGVVWAYSPLLDYDGRTTWVPQRDDLRPLHDLEEFIRDKSFFDPADEAVRHFQPGLGAAIADVVEEAAAGTADQERDVVASIVSLSDDPLVRSRLGAAKTATVPLGPGHWRETNDKHCPHEVTGAVVHGGPARLVQVCTKRSCVIHWPVTKKAKKPGAAAAAPAKPAGKPQWQLDQERREAEQKAWDALRPKAMGALVAHLTAHPVKFGAALVAMIGKPRDVERAWGVKLAERTAALVLLLHHVETYRRDSFARDAKTVKFDLAKWERAARAAERATTAERPAATRSATRAKKGGGK